MIRQASTGNKLRRKMWVHSFLLLLFAVSSLAKDQYHQHRSVEVEDAIRRYSREANVEIGPIKMKQFKREYAAEHSLVTDSESTKFKTKVECAGLCLSKQSCHAFRWMPQLDFNKVNVCRLLNIDDICLTTDNNSMDYKPIEIYADANENIPSCIVDCEWGPYGDWSPCSETWRSWTKHGSIHGGGERSRTRQVAMHASNGGLPCEGEPTETKSCNTEDFPVNCEWGPYGAWSPCSKTCGGGEKIRTRVVKTPASNGGEICEGNATEIEVCNTEGCPV